MINQYVSKYFRSIKNILKYNSQLCITDYTVLTVHTIMQTQKTKASQKKINKLYRDVCYKF